MAKQVEEHSLVLCDAIVPMVATDGKSLGLECTLTGVSDRLGLSLSIEAAKELHYQLGFALSVSTGDKTATGGAGFVRMTNVVGADAHATDPDKVLLALETDAGTYHYYALPPDTSADLRPKLRRAEADASRGVRLPRA